MAYGQKLTIIAVISRCNPRASARTTDILSDLYDASATVIAIRTPVRIAVACCGLESQPWASTRAVEAHVRFKFKAGVTVLVIGAIIQVAIVPR